MRKVSIIIPIYNVEKYLEECLVSVLKQNYSNYEVILVDDGSTDSSGIICDKYESEVVKVYHKENGGLSSARNFGLSKASGTYVMFVDSDDTICKNCLSILVANIEKYNCKMAMCRFTRKNNDLEEMCDSVTVISANDALKKILYQSDDSLYSVAACSKLFKMEVVKEVAFPKGKLNEDMFVICEFMMAAQKVVVCDFKGYYYRVNNNSITTKKFTHKNMDVISACEHIGEYITCHMNNDSQLLLAADNLMFRRSFQMLKKIWQCENEGQYIEDRKRLEIILKEKGNLIIHDKRAKISSKIAAILVCLGIEKFRLFIK